MSENTSTVPETPPASSSVSFLDWALPYLSRLKEMGSNAAAAVVAKVKKWSPLAQSSITLVLALAAGWLFLHWPSHSSFETPAAVDAKIAEAKKDVEDTIDRKVDSLTDVVARLPTADAIARTTAGKDEFVQLQTSLKTYEARLKKLEAEVAAHSAPASRKRR